MTTPRPLHPVDVLLLLTGADRVLLALRAGTGYADGQWNLPSGKLELGEDALSAVIREAREEIGVQLATDEPRMAAVVHHRNAAGLARVGLIFAVAYDPGRHGEPVNAEPHDPPQAPSPRRPQPHTMSNTLFGIAGTVAAVANPVRTF